MKFDYIIQNPPYNKSLHLDFLEKGLDLLTEKGRMVIIEPATWLINIRRKNGKGKRYDAIKQRIEGHVERVVIENLNKDFGTTLAIPFATTTIDMSKTFDSIEFVCCGERKVVKSIYDCNLVGDYELIWGIMEKCLGFGDFMKNHITGKNMGEQYHYVKYPEIYGGYGASLCGAITPRNGGKYEAEACWIKGSDGEFFLSYLSSGWHQNQGENSSESPVCRNDRGGNLTDKIADNVYGTKEELENWKHFIFSNKLPLFINIVLTIDQNNNSKEFLPWLVDKQYTDEEINKLFGFTDEEIALMNRTVKKYERNSPWFKRYMCGPGSVDSDPKKEEEIINNFINSL